MTNQRADYLIKGGLVITGDGISRRDVLVKDEVILRLGADLSGEPSARVIDATGKYVLPGIIDAHNHPVNADRVDTFSESAAFGGVTTIIPFIRNRRDVHRPFPRPVGQHHGRVAGFGLECLTVLAGRLSVCSWHTTLSNR